MVRLLSALQRLGCRLAEPGEFARRAFDNGKIDLAEAEGIADLIEAETEAQRVQALRQASGELSRLYEGWREELIGAMALMEAGIDFSDEADVARDAIEQARLVARDLASRIAAHLDDGRRGEILRDGFRVVLAGAPNAGKSSLLNALARRDAAIVSDEPGTTRDVIEVRLDLEGLPVIVSDTAGIRDATLEAIGAIETEGIRRSFEQGRMADLVLWVVDRAAPRWEVPRALQEAPFEMVLNKVDIADASVLALQEARARGVLCVSARSGDGIERLVNLITARADARIGLREAPALTQARHRAGLEACVSALQDALAQDVLSPELAAEDLRRGASALGRITGRVDPEDVLDQVFGRFCIGK